MARTWRNGFVLVVLLITLTPLWNAITLSQEFGADAQRWHWSQMRTRYSGYNADRPNVSLSHQPFRSVIDNPNQISDRSRTPQAATNRQTIRSPALLQPHPPISIESDADFTNQAIIEGWPGNGTQENPYVIRDLRISCTLGDLESECISIRQTRVHFLVTNCWLTDGEYCLLLENVANALIANNTCINSDPHSLFAPIKGIAVRDSNSIIIRNNTCVDTEFGLLVFDSFSTEIINNTIENCRYFGCEIYPVNNNILANNSLVNCGFFFGAWEEVEGMGSFVYIVAAPTRVGLGSSVDVNTQITGNTVNRRPLLLLVDRMGFEVPLGVGQIILLNCSYVTVKDQSLTNTSIGIFLWLTWQTRIFNNTCTGHSLDGIRMQDCTDITANNNLCTNNTFTGINLDETWDSTLSHNQCNNEKVVWAPDSWWSTEGCGIGLFGSCENILFNNTCNYNSRGILLVHTSGNQLLNNTHNHNRGAGIRILGDENTVRWNRCTDNWIGIEIEGQDNLVVANTCTNNSYGIYISDYVDIIINDNIMVSCGLYINYQGCEWIGNVDISSNTVNGRPLIFLKNRENVRVPSGAGQIILFNCREIRVWDQTFTDGSQCILVYCTYDSLFVKNIFEHNVGSGILVSDSHRNHFTLNSFSNNADYGIYLDGACRDNIVDWNIFRCNANHDACDDGPEFHTLGANTFDCNYWANYSTYNVIVGGFGDIPYNISGFAGNRDLHPLITPISVEVAQSAERLLLLLEGVVVLVLAIVVFVIIRAKLRTRSPNNPRSTLR